MTSHAFRQPSTRCGLIPSLRLFTWVLLPASVISQDSSSSHSNQPRAPQNENSSDDSISDLNRDGMLNLYFLFIAIAVVLLIIALFLIHRRKKRRKAMMRNYGQSALAQDINGPGGPPQVHARWIPGSRWGAASRAEEGLNERGEAPPPYHQPPGGPPYVPPPNGHFAPPTDAAGLAIPMRTLSRDTQGNKPPEYQDALQPGAPPPRSPSSSTGNLVPHDSQNQAVRP